MAQQCTGAAPSARKIISWEESRKGNGPSIRFLVKV